LLGRITLNGPLSDAESARSRSKRRRSWSAGRYSSRDPRLAPEEVLFRREDAPVRYAEHDIYWANEDLPDGGLGQLPNGDLLKSVHGYASRFYEAVAARLGPPCVVGTRLVDERSMDETALLAFGILIEEACRDAIGKKGDLAFTEGSTEQPTAGVAKAQRTGDFAAGWVSQGAREDVDEDTNVTSSHSGRRKKRRKVAEANLGEKHVP
jgi:hypothetical protein